MIKKKIKLDYVYIVYVLVRSVGFNWFSSFFFFFHFLFRIYYYIRLDACDINLTLKIIITYYIVTYVIVNRFINHYMYMN